MLKERDGEMKKLWHNGLIYTMEAEGETVEAVLTEGNRIIQTGAMEQLRELADEQIDLQGAVMYPGFVDSHIHLIMYGQKLQRLDLSKAESTQEMLALLQERALTLQEGNGYSVRDGMKTTSQIEEFHLLKSWMQCIKGQSSYRVFAIMYIFVIQKLYVKAASL